MSDNDAFISGLCTKPVEYSPEIVDASEEEVQEHFKNYIKETCTKQITLVEYLMPDEFKARVSKQTFFGWIHSFLHFEMGFEDYDPGMGHMDEVWESTFEEMEFKNFYMVHLKPVEDGPDFRQYAVNFNDLSRIDKVVFRIYNPDGET